MSKPAPSTIDERSEQKEAIVIDLMNRETSVRKLGERMSEKLFQRIMEIRAADNLKVLLQLPGPRCHPLQGKRRRQYAVDLIHPKRLILIPIFEKGVINEESVTEVAILEVVDYH